MLKTTLNSIVPFKLRLTSNIFFELRIILIFHEKIEFRDEFLKKTRCGGF